MAVLTSANGAITDKTTIQSMDGKIQLNFILADGSAESYIIDSNKLANREFTIEPGENRLSSFQILGSGHAISAATAATENAFIQVGGIDSNLIAANRTIENGVGKVDFETGNTRNIKNVSSMIGHAFPANTATLEKGAIVFTRVTGTAVGVSENGATITADTIVGGTGVGLIGARTIRLDEVAYPFTLETGESLVLQGSAVAFTS